MPNFDQAFAALIRDLDQRGMLDSTLVMVTTEFGRTPKINGTAGRDHWPRVFNIVLALKQAHCDRESRAAAKISKIALHNSARMPLSGSTSRLSSYFEPARLF
jgi:hypothetical protein